jgi:hypothetical protein
MTHEDTTHKRVTLPIGVVVTDVGANDEFTRKCVAEDGTVYIIINRVIRELPFTFRRNELR